MRLDGTRLLCFCLALRWSYRTTRGKYARVAVAKTLGWYPTLPAAYVAAYVPTYVPPYILIKHIARHRALDATADGTLYAGGFLIGG